MERRKFIIGTGALVAGGAAGLGTGAFSYVRAERDITVTVADDENAYLRLSGNSEYASEENGELALDFAGGNDQNGDGLNANADSRFDNVFVIENQGTNDARISFHDTEGAVGYNSPAATWYYTKGSSGEAVGDGEVNADNPVIGPGETLYIHVIFWLTEEDEKDIPDHLGIVAEEP